MAREEGQDDLTTGAGERKGVDLVDLKIKLKGLFAAQTKSLESLGTTSEESNTILRDMRAVRRAIELCDEALLEGSTADSVALKEALFETKITAEVRSAIADICPALAANEQELRDHHFEKGKIAAANLCKYKWDQNPPLVARFFDRIFGDEKPGINANLEVENVNTLIDLEQKFSKRYPGRYDGLPHMLFDAMGGNIKKVERLIDAQWPDESESQENDFFDSMLNFLTKFAYVSEAVMEFGGEQLSGKSAEIQKRSADVFKRILFDDRLLNRDRQHDCLTIFSEYVRKNEGVDNPWLIANLDETPFSATKLRHGMDPEYSPRILVAAILDLYQHDRDAGLAFDLDALRPPEDINALFQFNALRLELLDPKKIVKSREVQRIFNKDLVSGLLPKLTVKHKARILAAMTNCPKEVAAGWSDRKIRKDFEAYESEHPTIPWDQLLKKTEEYYDEDSEFKNDGTSFLVASFERIFELPNPYLDIPIPLGKIEAKSIRETLMEVGLAVFPQLDHEAENRALPMVEAMGMIEKYGEDNLKRYFDTAAIGLERPYLLRVADAIIETYKEKYPDADRAFKVLLDEAKDQVNTYFGADDKYEIGLYSAATYAFKAFAEKCLSSPLNRGAVVATNHEHQSVVDDFNFGGGIRTIYINDGIQRQKSAEEIYDEFDKAISAPGDIEMVVISSETSYGDSIKDLPALVARIKAKYSNIPVLVDMCQSAGRTDQSLMKCAEIAADLYLISGQKAIGAGGVGGILVSKDYNQKLHEGRRFVYKTPATEPLRNFVALGLALKSLRSKQDLFRTEGNFSNLGGMRLDQKAAERFQMLSEHAITLAGSYAQRFSAKLEHSGAVGEAIINKLDAESRMSLRSAEDEESGFGAEKSTPRGEKTPFIDSLTRDIVKRFDGANVEAENLGRMLAAEIFKCDVVNPVNKEDLNGILVVSFPNIRSKELATKLRSLGFNISIRLYKDRGLRISFNYMHSIEDVDALFEAIMNIHMEKLIAKCGDISTWDKIDGKLRFVRTEDWAERPHPIA